MMNNDRNKTVSVKDFGAVGDGRTDDYLAFRAALSSGAAEVLIPFGEYSVSDTLYIGSNTRLIADRCAKVVMKRSSRAKRGDFLLSAIDGSENISVEGGIWDGKNSDEKNAKPDLFDKEGYSGSVLNFVGVRGLRLSGLTVANSTTYYIRMSRVEDFLIEDIDFISDEFGHNQDGLHFGGGVRRGRVRNIRALSRGQTNDDMIALNADDSVERVENFDLVRDDIEDIEFENIYAENCYTVIRMLSVGVKIRNIKFKNIYAGYRHYAINGDGARYCKTPLFDEEDHPLGVGLCENIEIENFVCYAQNEKFDHPRCTEPEPYHALRLECNFNNFVIRGFKKIKGKNDEGTYALYMKNVVGSRIVADGKEYLLEKKSDEALIEDFNELRIDMMR